MLSQICLQFKINLKKNNLKIINLMNQKYNLFRNFKDHNLKIILRIFCKTLLLANIYESKFFCVLNEILFS